MSTSVNHPLSSRAALVPAMLVGATVALALLAIPSAAASGGLGEWLLTGLENRWKWGADWTPEFGPWAWLVLTPACRSRPLMPSMRISTTRHAIRSIGAEARKSPADAKTSTHRKSRINHDDFGIRMLLVGKSTQTVFEKSLAIPINNDNADFVIVFSRDHPCQVEAEAGLSVSYAIFARYSFKPSIPQPSDLLSPPQWRARKRFWYECCQSFSLLGIFQDISLFSSERKVSVTCETKLHLANAARVLFDPIHHAQFSQR